MANIKVTIDHPISDGTKLKFRTPCESTEVDGLVVRYPVKNGVGNVVKTFTFVDAHGTALSGVGNVFTSDVLIEVLLDVTKGRAYIKNADTNSYIEDIKVTVKRMDEERQVIFAEVGKAIEDCNASTKGAVEDCNAAIGKVDDVLNNPILKNLEEVSPIEFVIDGMITEQDPFECQYFVGITNNGETILFNVIEKENDKLTAYATNGEKQFKIAFIKTGDNYMVACVHEFDKFYGYNTLAIIENMSEMEEALSTKADAKETKEALSTKANVYEYNDEIRCTSVESIPFVVSEGAEKKGITIVNNNNEDQYIDHITVDGAEYWLNRALNYGEPFNFRLTEENAENTYDLWKAGAECEIHFSPAYVLELLDVSVFVPTKVDVKDCYEKSSEALADAKTVKKKLEAFGLGKTVIKPDMYAGDLTVKSPYGNNCDVTFDFHTSSEEGVPVGILINGLQFNIRADWYNIVAGTQIRYIDLNNNKMHYLDGGSEGVVDNLYESPDWSIQEAFGYGVDYDLELDFGCGLNNFGVQHPFDIVFELNPNNGVWNIPEKSEGRLVTVGELNRSLEWKLLAELVVEEPTKNLMVDFGAPIENWYSETMIHLYAPVNADNTGRLKSRIQFGDTEADANTPWNEGWGVILDAQNDNYGGISHSVLINAAFTTQWVNREKAVYTDLRYTGYGSVCYPQNMFGCAIDTEGRNNWTIKNKRFMSFRSRDNAFVFPKGTILRIYGRG